MLVKWSSLLKNKLPTINNIDWFPILGVLGQGWDSTAVPRLGFRWPGSLIRPLRHRLPGICPCGAGAPARVSVAISLPWDAAPTSRDGASPRLRTETRSAGQKSPHRHGSRVPHTFAVFANVWASTPPHSSPCPVQALLGRVFTKAIGACLPARARSWARCAETS